MASAINFAHPRIDSGSQLPQHSLFNRRNLTTQLNKLPSSITELDLSQHGLQQIPDLSKFVGLKRLVLSGNDLKQIPQEILNLPNLQELLLDGNSSLSDLSGISRLEKLEILDLTGCAITQWPAEFAFMEALREVNLMLGNNTYACSGTNFIVQIPLQYCPESLEKVTIPALMGWGFAGGLSVDQAFMNQFIEYPAQDIDGNDYIEYHRLTDMGMDSSSGSEFGFVSSDDFDKEVFVNLGIFGSPLRV